MQINNHIIIWRILFWTIILYCSQYYFVKNWLHLLYLYICQLKHNIRRVVPSSSHLTASL